MKNFFRIAGVSLLFLSVFSYYSCKKEKPLPPTLSTTAITEISYTTAISGCDVTNDGGSPILTKGICWNTTSDPTTSNNKTTESGSLGAFTNSMVQLTPNTMYYARAYATNAAGTGYGTQVSFTTLKVETASITTTDATSITQAGATLKGNVTNENGGSVTARGVCWGTTTGPTIADGKTTDGTGMGSFVSKLTGLIGNTMYYVRAYATNMAGTSYGNQVIFKTNPLLPALSTLPLNSLTSSSCISGGEISSDGGAGITARGVCWSLEPNPTTDNYITINDAGLGIFNSTISGLDPGKDYYIRAYATNSVGTGYGNILTFTTPLNEIVFNPDLTYGTLTDVDNNIYKTIAIGTQVWTAENLKTTRYNDGTLISNVTDNSNWSGLLSAGYCCYLNNEITYKPIYGFMYNWYAVNTAKLCPADWHVSNNTDWTLLTITLGGEGSAGDKLKEAGIAHWKSEFVWIPGTNESGFTALPGGDRWYDGSFSSIGYFGAWWSSTEYTTENAYGFSMSCSNSAVSSNTYSSHKQSGYYVRCVKD